MDMDDLKMKKFLNNLMGLSLSSFLISKGYVSKSKSSKDKDLLIFIKNDEGTENWHGFCRLYTG